MKIHTSVDIDIDEIFRAIDFDCIEVGEVFDWHRSFVEMDEEMKERHKKGGDDNWDKNLWTKYNALEILVVKQIVKEIKRHIKEEYKEYE